MSSTPGQQDARATIVIRAGREADIPYVMDSFWRGYGGTPHAHGTPTEVLRGRLAALLSAPDWDLSVACAGDGQDADEILGWVLAKPGPRPTLAWVHVRKGAWRRGIGGALAKHAGLTRTGMHVECAFLDPDVAHWMRQRFAVRLFLRPYLPDVAMLEERSRRLAAEMTSDADEHEAAGR